MSPSAEEQRRDELPEPLVALPRRWGISLVWLVPAIAALVGLGLVVRAYFQAGPSITISFETAEGLTAGQTEVRYKEVVIGRVRSIALSENYGRVIASVELAKHAAPLAVEDTRFWVVRPRVDLGGVSGLGTLVSGAYIGMDVGTSEQPERHFVGLEVPPPVTTDRQGTRFMIHGQALGSLNLGSPVYYRNIPVGEVVAFDLRADGRAVVIQVFVEAPYDRYVTEDTRFWNASGVDVNVSANGLQFNTESLLAIVAGGLAFRSISDDGSSPPAPSEAAFTLFPDQSSALAPEDGAPLLVRMRFNQSTRGLTVDAPVDFRGIDLGQVRSIDLDFDLERKRFFADVLAEVYPRRLGRALGTLGGDAQKDDTEQFRAILSDLIGRGLRAQLRTGNIITGQLYVTLDFLPQSTADATSPGEPLEIPTAPGSLEQIQTQMAEIVSELNRIPFGEIGTELLDTLGNLDALLGRAQGEIAPEVQGLLLQLRRTLDGLDRALGDSEAPLQIETRQALDEVERTARSLRSLVDYLQRHPESLIRGRSEGRFSEEQGP